MTANGEIHLTTPNPLTTAETIPLAAPDLTGREAEYVAHAIESSWISSTGEYVDRFESEFAELCGTRSAISVCNGTAALHLALLALGVQERDEVLVPSLTYIATANAVRYVGAEPAFVDCDPETWCIDPRLLEASITRRTKGIIAVHLYGHPADMDEINRIAALHGLWVLEDAAEAHFARYKGRVVGGLAEMATFSFYGNKMFTSGEGGAITIDDLNVAQRIRLLRGQGMDPDRRYYFPIVGFNARLTNIACALLCAQLERREEIIAARRSVFRYYDQLLGEIRGIRRQPRAVWAEPAPWLYCITVDKSEFGCGRDELAECLRVKGIETRPFFIPLHTLPPYADAVCGGDLPVTSQLAATGLSLPTFSTMSPKDVARVCEAITSSRP
jgi:perosamine synthetase